MAHIHIRKELPGSVDIRKPYSDFEEAVRDFADWVSGDRIEMELHTFDELWQVIALHDAGYKLEIKDFWIKDKSIVFVNPTSVEKCFITPGEYNKTSLKAISVYRECSGILCTAEQKIEILEPKPVKNDGSNLVLIFVTDEKSPRKDLPHFTNMANVNVYITTRDV